MIPVDPSTQTPQRYQIPTHLNVPDKIAVNLMGLSIEMTIRQGLIYLFGAGIAYHLWRSLAWLGPSGLGATTRLLLLGIVIILSLLFATLRIANRHAETWLAILLQYAIQPKVYIWKNIIFDPTYRLGEIDPEADEELEADDDEEEEEV